MAKPPAFQFYAKDWRSSPTRRCMGLKDKAIFLELMALAWDSEEQGVISLPFDHICRDLGVTPATLRRYVDAFPTTCARRVDGALVLPKLQEQAAKYREISEKRSKAASKSHANAGQKHPIAFASAFASASEDFKSIPTPAGVGALEATPMFGVVHPSNHFDIFWEAYPRKIDKQAARKSWKKIDGDARLGDILASLRAWKALSQWQEQQFIPYPSTWLNGGRWKETPKEAATAPANGTTRLSREDERRERSQQAIENVVGHRSGLVERLRAGLSRDADRGTNPRLPDGSRAVDAPRRLAPSVSPGNETLEMEADARGGHSSVRGGVRSTASAEGIATATRGSDNAGRESGVRAGDERPETKTITAGEEVA